LPPAVILDIRLAQLDGYEVARRYRTMPELAGAFLIPLRGYGQEEDRRKTKESGFDVHLVKPADLMEIKNATDSFGRDLPNSTPLQAQQQVP
jgi:CheY-like chemotaxis protein